MMHKFCALVIAVITLAGCSSTNEAPYHEYHPILIQQEEEETKAMQAAARLDAARSDPQFVAALEEVRNQKDPIFNRGSSPKIDLEEHNALTDTAREIRSRIQQIDKELHDLEDLAAKKFAEDKAMPPGFENQHYLLSEERNQLVFELEVEGIGDLGRLNKEEG